MERFSNLPTEQDDFLYCMICVTDIKERYTNYLNQKIVLPNLALYSAITPFAEFFDKQCSMINWHPILDNKKGTKALWLSQIEIFTYFLKTNHKYLVLLEDDAIVPNDFEYVLRNRYINDKEYLKLGGIRLGQYASCNLYNKFCAKNIIDTIHNPKYPIDRNLDHYVSNIGTGTGEYRPFILLCGSDGDGSGHLPATLVKVEPSISRKSVRIKNDKTLVTK